MTNIKKTSKLLILVSDGEDHSEGAEAAAEEANKLGIDNGRNSARWIMKMKDVPFVNWNTVSGITNSCVHVEDMILSLNRSTLGNAALSKISSIRSLPSMPSSDFSIPYLPTEGVVPAVLLGAPISAEGDQLPGRPEVEGVLIPSNISGIFPKSSLSLR